MQGVDPSKRQLTRITCAPHVTPFLRREVEALGFEIQEEDHVAVHVGATLIECADLCLRVRTAHHVRWLLHRVRCPSPKALYTHVSSFPWEMLIDVDAYLTVTSNVENPKITNSMYPNLVMKDAIVDRINKQMGARPDSGPERTGVVIHLAWKDDRAWVYLNVNGIRLADRGYRRMPHKAPMQETLAAAVLMATGYDGSQPLINPMCGSGTIAIEAALMATGRAPGLLRTNYGALHTSFDLADAWESARREAKKLSAKSTSPPPPIIASDIDPRAIEAAKKNAQTAGVEHLIQFETCDCAETTVPAQENERGHVILNPEYGERLGDESELEATYGRIGDFLKQKCAGWTGHVFTGNPNLAKRIGLRVSKRQHFMNARIDCRLLTYDLYQGTRRRE